MLAAAAVSIRRRALCFACHPHHARMARPVQRIVAALGQLHAADADVGGRLAALRDTYAQLDVAARRELWGSTDVHARSIAKAAKLFTREPWGLNFLVGVRGDMLSCLRAQQVPPSLGVAIAVLKRQIQTAILDGLEFAPVDPDAPIELKQRIIHYESVHPMHSLHDLDQRLRPPHRYVFVLTHPRLRDPIATLHVALTRGIERSVPRLFEYSAEARVDTAMFYSVNSTMRGLAGIDMGSRIIKRAVAWLQHRRPEIAHFSTLSPIPTFAAWLRMNDGWARAMDAVPAAALDRAKARFGSVAALAQVIETPPASSSSAAAWVADPAVSTVIGEVLTPLCAHFLLHVRTDPVFRFHVGNGAVVYRVNWLGDTSAKGLAQSHSVMVNYLYPVGQLEANAKEFRVHGRVPSRL